MPKKNVILILSDQQQANALGCVDSSYYTPNIDQLLRDKGVRFSNAFCAAGQCTPSRASLMTGRYPHQVGVLQVGHVLPPNVMTVGHVFADAQYQTAYFGKWHLSSPYFGKWHEVPDGYGFQITKYSTGDSELDEVKLTNRTEQLDDIITMAMALNYLRDLPENTPFFLIISLNAPHPPFVKIKPFDELFSLEAMPVPKSFYTDDLCTKPVWQAERARGTLPHSGESQITEDIIRRDALAYRSQVAWFDQCIGQITELLDKKNLLNHTSLVLSSDHGDMQGSHRLRYKGVFGYNELYKIPLIIYDRSLRPGRTTIDDLVVNTAVPGTLIELAGLKVPADIEGGSLLPKIFSTTPSDEEIFIEHWRAYWGFHPFRGVVTKRWKYLFYFQDGAEELYDLKEDPDEITNLASNSAYQAVIRGCRSEVDKWWHRTGELNVQPIEMSKEIPPQITNWDDLSDRHLK